VVAPYQHNCHHYNQQQQNPYDDPHYFAPVRFRTVSRELMATIDDGMLIRVNGQKESPFSAANPQLFCTKQKVSVAPKTEFVRRRRRF
jgi:hypothetical protein